MSSAARSRYTLIIPTYNRPDRLRSLLGYLGARRFDYPILVVDSSSEPMLAENRRTIDLAGLRITHQIHDPAIAVVDKFARAAQSVETPYCSFCADDDILLTRDLDALIRFLDDNPSFVAAHGYYVNFKPGDDFEVSYTTYSAASIAADDALRRIVEQMANYEAIFYAVQRSETTRCVLQQLASERSPLAYELLASSLTLIAGGVHREPFFYMARDTSPSIARAAWHPHHFLATDPMSLFQAYVEYRAVVLERLSADPRCRERYTPAQMERAFDLAHLRYLAPMISGPVMDWILDQSLAPASQPSEIADAISSKFWASADGAADGMLGQLRRALYDPERAVRLVRHLARLSRLRWQLQFREGLSAAMARRPGNMYISRRTRAGQRRRYVLFREFLIQNLGDRRELSAARIRQMIEQLDDYI